MGELWRQAQAATERFDRAAAAYDTFRPGFPEDLYDELIDRCDLEADDAVVEVGAGTGIVSEPLARRGLRLLCIEPAPHMAAVARAKLERLGEHEIVETTFEDWAEPERPAKALVAANSWHWVDPIIGWSKAARVVGPRGALALLWHDLIGYEPANFARRLAEVGGDLNPALRADPTDLGLDTQATWADRIAQSGFFDAPVTSRHRFRRTLDSASFVATLNSYGVNAQLDAQTQAQLDRRLIELVDAEFGGSIMKIEDGVLHTARVLAGPRDI